jgi:hypothetical protein
MDPLLGLLTAGIGASLVYLLSSFRLRQRSDAWRQAARAAQLTDVEATGFMGWETRLTGHSGPLRVRMESYQHGKNERGTRIVVEGLRHGQYALTIRSEGSHRPSKRLGERENRAGDDAFDRRPTCRARRACSGALFDADTRRRCARCSKGWHVPGRGAQPLAVRTHISDSDCSRDQESLFETFQGPPRALPLIVDPKRLARPMISRRRLPPTPPRAVAGGAARQSQLLAREHWPTPTHETCWARSPTRRRRCGCRPPSQSARRAWCSRTATQAHDDDLAAKAIVALGERVPGPAGHRPPQARGRIGADASARASASSVAPAPRGHRALVRVLVDEREAWRRLRDRLLPPRRARRPNARSFSHSAAMPHPSGLPRRRLSDGSVRHRR